MFGSSLGILRKLCIAKTEIVRFDLQHLTYTPPLGLEGLTEGFVPDWGGAFCHNLTSAAIYHLSGHLDEALNHITCFKLVTFNSLNQTL